MLASRTARLLAITVAALSTSACSWDCGTVRRTVANGRVRDAAGVTLATVQVDLSDNLRPTFLRLSAGVMAPAGSAGAPLRGHVTRARLVTAEGDVLAEIPTGTATLYLDGVVALNVDLPSEAEYARVRGALLTARARVVLETDLPGRERLETTLADARHVPGQIQRCSPA
jgi:hypothetical protein